MRYLLVNDTSETNNPGCQGTMACLRGLLKDIDLHEVGSLPVGFGQHLFNDFSNKPFRRRAVSWALTLGKFKKQISKTFSNLDLVVINGEGTIHHNRPAAFAILAIAEIAIKSGLRVVLVNGTIQDMNESLLRRVLPHLDWIIVREKRSLLYLRSLGISANFAPDCLFTYWSSMEREPTNCRTSNCLYTPGVLGLSGELKPEDVSKHLCQISRAGFSPSYFVAEVEDERFVSLAKSMGAKIIEIADVPWFALPEFLSSFSLIISGRYHISIYGWLAGVPTIPMPSNSWKMEGLFDLVDPEIASETMRMNFETRINRGGFVLDDEELSKMEMLCRSEFSRMGSILNSKNEQTV